jgi:hypothetical protein
MDAPDLLECFLKHPDPNDIVFPLDYALLRREQFNDLTLQAAWQAQPTKFVIHDFGTVQLLCHVTQPNAPWKIAIPTSLLKTHQYCSLVSLRSQPHWNDAIVTNHIRVGLQSSSTTPCIFSCLAGKFFVIGTQVFRCRIQVLRNLVKILTMLSFVIMTLFIPDVLQKFQNSIVY